MRLSVLLKMHLVFFQQQFQIVDFYQHRKDVVHHLKKRTFMAAISREIAVSITSENGGTGPKCKYHTGFIQSDMSVSLPRCT